MCRNIETTQLVTRTVNGRTFEVLNPRYLEIGVLQVDGCLIDDRSRRVDWAIELPERKKLKHGVKSVKLVELKGRDVLYAFTQMEATLVHPAMAEIRPLIDEGFIVSQQSPAMLSAIQVAKSNFQDSFGLPVRVTAKAVIDARS